MKKILTLSAIAIFFASNFANATTSTTGSGGKTTSTTAVKSSKSVKAHYTKITTKEFSIKKMQDTKDILLPMTPNTNVIDFSIHKS